MLKVAKTVTIVFTVIEATMILALIGLEISSGYRAGIMHHLYFQKRQYLATFYNESNLVYHLTGIALSTGAILFCCRPRLRSTGKEVLIRYGVVLVSLILSYLLPWFNKLNIFAHLLIVLECCLALETIRILVLLGRNGKHMQPAKKLYKAT